MTGQNSNEITINNKSSFKSHLVRSQSILDDCQYNNLIIRAMGKATSKAIILAHELNKNNYYAFDLKPETYTVDLLDDDRLVRGAERDAFDPDNIDVTKKLITRLPAIKIKVSKNQLEVNKLTHLAKLNHNDS